MPSGLSFARQIETGCWPITPGRLNRARYSSVDSVLLGGFPNRGPKSSSDLNWWQVNTNKSSSLKAVSSSLNTKELVLKKHSSSSRLFFFWNFRCFLMTDLMPE